jgi:hypothetical protein
MNFKRKYLDELEKLTDRSTVVGSVICIFDSRNGQDHIDYLAALSDKAEEEARTQAGPDGTIDRDVGMRACLQFFSEAFEDDDRAMWEYLTSANQEELLGVFFGSVFRDEPVRLHAYLRSFLQEEDVRMFIEEDSEIIREYGITYQPLETATD